MNTITEIEAAIEKLPTQQVNELANWLEEFRASRATTKDYANWLRQAKGAATTGITTEELMKITRGEE